MEQREKGPGLTAGSLRYYVVNLVPYPVGQELWSSRFASLKSVINEPTSRLTIVSWTCGNTKSALNV